jgi:hypothetical protein
VTVEFGDKLGELLDTVRMRAQHSNRFLQLHTAYPAAAAGSAAPCVEQGSKPAKAS